jgi:hypothetical protein
MTENPNKLLQFWQELKRRKVVKVIALYATTAFFLVQIVYILVEPLHLPAWVMSLFTVLLIIGFSQFEEVYGKMRILTKPDGYIIDQDHHVHLANQTVSFDWQFYAEMLLMMEKIESYEFKKSFVRLD